MAWDSLDTYRSGLDFFTAIVDAAPDDGWSRPSPCEGWSALDVLGHVGAATWAGTRILRGEAFELVAHVPPSSGVDGEPKAWWRSLVGGARSSVDGDVDLDRIVESPMGPRSVREGLSFPAADLFLHGWDLGTATGQDVVLPDEAIAFIHGMFARIPDDAVRRPGVFGPAVTAQSEASPTDDLIAYTGRDPGR